MAELKKSYVWFAEGPGVILPAEVVEGDPTQDGELDLVILRSTSARTINPRDELGVPGPPEIEVAEGDDTLREDLSDVPYDANGENGTWHRT